MKKEENMHLNVPDSPNNSAKDILQQALQGDQLHHAGLMFYRYLDGQESSRCEYFYIKEVNVNGRTKYVDTCRRKNENCDLKGKEPAICQLEELIKRAQFLTLNPYIDRILSLCRDQKQRGHNLATSCFQATLVGRLAPGLGIPSVFENGISLHHIHGFPYILGSSLKGIAQDYALKIKEVDKNSQEFIAVFGKQTPQGKTGETFEVQQSKAIFFDAIPLETRIEGKELLTLDVMTPHYAEYYSSEGKKPPGDYLDPNPIVFLTVKEGVSFLFCLRARDLKSKDSVVMKAEDILCYAKDWLWGALSTLGAGAKTSVGYGYFQDFQAYNPWLDGGCYGG